MELRFQRPARQIPIIANARPRAVSEITHQRPVVPHRAAAHAASGIRLAVIAVDVSIGARVCPAPPSAASSTISAQIPSCDTAAMRRYLAPSAITAGSWLKIAEKGAGTTIFLATAPEVGGVSGRYFAHRAEVRPTRVAQDDALARRLWEVSEKLTGLA